MGWKLPGIERWSAHPRRKSRAVNSGPRFNEILLAEDGVPSYASADSFSTTTLMWLMTSRCKRMATSNSPMLFKGSFS
jgi:hypothetical protein